MCFSENFCWQTKNIHNFFGDNTRFTPGIEAWSRATKKMGFRMDTKKIKFRKEKGMTPYWPPVPTSRGTNQPKWYYRGTNPIKLHILVLVSRIWQRSSRVMDRLVVSSFVYGVEGAVFKSHWICIWSAFEQTTCKWNFENGILDDSHSQKYWFCLRKCMQMFMGGPEPLEKEIHEILGSKREDRFSDPFFDWVQNASLIRFSYLLRLCNFCKAPRDMRKFPQKCQKIAGC